MKTELTRLVRQFESVYNGQPWYGDSLRSKLDQVGPEEAFATPVPDGRSIAQLTTHILVWRRVLAEQLKGNAAFKVELNSEQDWPSQETLQAKGWQNILDELAENQRELLLLFSGETDELLNKPYQKKYDFRFLIEGVVQHDIYHTGQIGLLLSLSKEPAK